MQPSTATVVATQEPFAFLTASIVHNVLKNAPAAPGSWPIQLGEPFSKARLLVGYTQLALFAVSTQLDSACQFADTFTAASSSSPSDPSWLDRSDLTTPMLFVRFIATPLLLMLINHCTPLPSPAVDAAGGKPGNCVQHCLRFSMVILMLPFR